jgi:predicted secreted acid phosphatase
MEEMMFSIFKRRTLSVGGRHSFRRWAAIVAGAMLVSLLLRDPAPAQEAANCTPPAPASAFDPARPNLGQLKLQLLYYQCSAYEADVRTELAKARAWVEQRAGQVVNPAIVLEIDETSLSNWAQIKRNDFGYIENGACDGDTQSACGQRDWVLSAAGVAIPPTLELFNAAKARNVAVFFITGRVDDPVQKAATEFNLRKVGYFGWDGLFMRDPKTGRRPVSEHKTAARIEIEQRGYTIIANVGDQESDLVNGHADMIFKVPNPFYFIE